MRKILLNFTIFIWLIIFFISKIFAFNASLQLNKSEININDYVNLRVEISSTQWWEIWIIDIKWLDNFDLISQSQSQNSSTNIVSVNWKIQNETKTTINLDLTLKPKVKWEFTLWPATLEWNWWEVLTNSVKIKVWWDSLFVNSNQNKINNLWIQNNPQKDIKIETYNDIEKRNFDNNDDLYLLLIILLITWIWLYLLNKNNPNLLVKILWNKKENWSKKENWNKDKDKDKDKEYIESNNKKINFENIEKINYPEINDSNFIQKIDIILREKIKNNYGVKNIKKLTFDEILEIIKQDIKKEKDIKEKDVEELIILLNKAKYSNNIWNNSKILELLKEI